MIEKEIKKSDLIDVIEYELNYHDQAHKAEIEEKNTQIAAKNKEISAKDKEISAKDKEISAKDAEIILLKEKLNENGITY